MSANATPPPRSQPLRPPVPRGLARRLEAPVDGAWLAAFRIAFGIVVLWETYRYFSNGWIRHYWIESTYTFSYPGLEWVTPLPGQAMYVVWAGIGVAGACIALGIFYRAAAIGFTILFTYSFLLEYALYLNHFYLMILLGMILAVVPAQRVWSVDSALERDALTTVPTWALWLFRFQVGVMYVGGSIAKMSPDWLAGRPLDAWLVAGADWPIVGDALLRSGTAVGLAWAGLALDLLIVPLVMWRRTRVVALVSIGLFHLVNARLFSIGVFPVLAMAATLVFLPPDWPRTLVTRVGRLLSLLPGVPWTGAVANSPTPFLPTGVQARPEGLSNLAALILVVFVAAQVIVPLRHLAIPGEANWTEEGHDFAWHMKLRSKSGGIDFVVADQLTGTVWIPDLEQDLSTWQIRRMAARPRMIVQYAEELARQAIDVHGFARPSVNADAMVSLNGRPHTPMIVADIDLLTIEDISDIILPHPDAQAEQL